MISDFVKPLVTAKVSDLKQAVYVTKKDKGQSGLVTIRAQPLSLEKFQYSPRVPRKRPPKKGVRSTVRRKSPIYRGDAFVRPDRFGTFRIFTRERKSRYPLTKLYGPSTYTLFRYNKKNMKQIKKQLMKRFALELASQRTRFLGKYGKR